LRRYTIRLTASLSILCIILLI